ncbi:flagellar basal body rod protein FlgG [Salibacterium salarium]|uniref:Flagellar hook protein FlgE n=1 Tax=Salibacterium salarium TaxID=284579 RepID=A0A428N318_9BACI|nr:flagellar basal body rod protein FlgG [Salibacterium salarium]RSL32850.1 flagellar basal body rod protein FlgG [Salibacterium salarium]
MLASMYSGISGMKNFQQKLDVTGNNLANVNTFGFKKGRATFKDMVSQQIAGATGPTETAGGSNAMQVGLGSQMGSIDTVHTQGSLQNTNRDLDFGISGDGFFSVAELNDGNTDDTWDGGVQGDQVTTNYTRAGNFYLDEEGYVVNQDGKYLMGADTDDGNYGRINIPTDADSFSVGSDGTVSYQQDGNLEEAGQVLMATFPNPEGLTKIGNNLFQTSDNSGNVGGVDPAGLGNAFEAYTNPGADGAGELVAGTLEMSNVDMSEEFTEMITAQRGFQANTRGITTADEVLQELMNLKR